MGEAAQVTGGDDKARNTPVSMKTEDVERVEAIRRHFGDDTFSKAVRRAVEMAAKGIDGERDEEVA